MKDETYYRDQTPPKLALELIKYLPIEFDDICWEPFMGEGAFYNALKTKSRDVNWCEIEEGRDYKDAHGNFDWIVTNPPFGTNGAFWKHLLEFAPRCNKGLALLGNDYCFSALTPKRIKILNDLGVYLSKIVICNVKKWRGRYYFMIFTHNKNDSFKFLNDYY